MLYIFGSSVCQTPDFDSDGGDGDGGVDRSMKLDH